MFTPINRINSIEELQISQKNNLNLSNANNTDFRSIFSEAVANVIETEDNLAKEQYLFATGQSNDTHTLSIAATKAQVSVDLLVALRNKALESYSEVMRISL
ncbi:MAG: flagellar hook-basal body complex protein FliE [Anaerotignaceae bacterium]